MPELPDLVHIVKSLAPRLEGRRIVSVVVKEPIVLRVLVAGDFRDLVAGMGFSGLERHGPFLRFRLECAEPGRGLKPPLDLVMHLMLAGRLRLGPVADKALAYTAFTLALDNGELLSYADEKNMGKIYLCPGEDYRSIPGYLEQGVDVTSEAFSYEFFSSLIAKKRCQARVFVMDQSSLSAIGNAYADEILFEAGIHPKTSCHSLSPEKRRALYDAIRAVLDWGIEEVAAAGKALEDKARGHMRVRNRAGQGCPRCGAIIRKAGVLGYDAFFCPRCQPDSSGKGLDWNKLPR